MSIQPTAITFSNLQLTLPLLQAVERLGFTTPTEVQAKVIPIALAGRDCLVSSQTGSGKTAAFLLPLLHGLMNDGQRPMPARAEPKLLILCPTRELAQQVAADAIDLLRAWRGVRVATVVGGMPYGKQIAQVKGAAVVIATPGRLIDLNDTRAIRLDKVEKLVIDEADRMLDLGFADALEDINARCMARDQTLMFSATFAPRVMKIAERMTKQAERIELATALSKHENISQTLHWADDRAHKQRLLTHCLADPEMNQAVIFASTQVDSERLADSLRAEGYSASALHGGMPQNMRNRRLDDVRSGRTKILVATDVAARGIDVPAISHVINYGLPMKPEDYVHRIGRTGRAGRNGIAVTLAEHSERGRIRDIERYTDQRLQATTVPGLEPRARAQVNSKPPGRGAPRPGARSGAAPRTGFKSPSAFKAPFSADGARKPGPSRSAGYGGAEGRRDGAAPARPARTFSPAARPRFKAD